MKITIVGGGAAGSTVAFELRKLNKKAEIKIVDKSSIIGYSPCSFPYYISGEIEKEELFNFRKKDYSINDIEVLLKNEVKSIDREKRKLILENENIKYDKLVLATGSVCSIPKINGLTKIEFLTLKDINDAEKIKKAAGKKKTFVIIGGGLIGIELASALIKKKSAVCVIEKENEILPKVLDSNMAIYVREFLEKRGVKFYTNSQIRQIKKGKIVLKNKNVEFDELVLATGFLPNIKLARLCGLAANKGIKVNGFLQTSDKAIYSCGNCIEYVEFYTRKKIISQLGSNAVKEARIVARNMLGKKIRFPEILNNTISYIDGLYIGSVGLTEKRIKELKKNCFSVVYETKTRKHKGKKIIAKVISDPKKKIVGGQIISEENISGEMNFLSLIIRKCDNLEEVSKIETCYNPFTSHVFDPILVSSEICEKKIKLKNENT